MPKLFQRIIAVVLTFTLLGVDPSWALGTPSSFEVSREVTFASITRLNQEALTNWAIVSFDVLNHKMSHIRTRFHLFETPNASGLWSYLGQPSRYEGQAHQRSMRRIISWAAPLSEAVGASAILYAATYRALLNHMSFEQAYGMSLLVVAILFGALHGVAFDKQGDTLVTVSLRQNPRFVATVMLKKFLYALFIWGPLYGVSLYYNSTPGMNLVLSSFIAILIQLYTDQQFLAKTSSSPLPRQITERRQLNNPKDAHESYEARLARVFHDMAMALMVTSTLFASLDISYVMNMLALFVLPFLLIAQNVLGRMQVGVNGQTGLPSGSLFQSILRERYQSLAGRRAEENSPENERRRTARRDPMVVMTISMLGLKSLNEGPGGYEAGNRALQNVASVLKEIQLQYGTDVFIAHPDGDTFQLVANNMSQDRYVALAHRIVSHPALEGVTMEDRRRGGTIQAGSVCLGFSNYDGQRAKSAALLLGESKTGMEIAKYFSRHPDTTLSKRFPITMIENPFSIEKTDPNYLEWAGRLLIARIIVNSQEYKFDPDAAMVVRDRLEKELLEWIEIHRHDSAGELEKMKETLEKSAKLLDGASQRPKTLQEDAKILSSGWEKPSTGRVTELEVNLLTAPLIPHQPTLVERFWRRLQELVHDYPLIIMAQRGEKHSQMISYVGAGGFLIRFIYHLTTRHLPPLEMLFGAVSIAAIMWIHRRRILAIEERNSTTLLPGITSFERELTSDFGIYKKAKPSNTTADTTKKDGPKLYLFMIDMIGLGALNKVSFDQGDKALRNLRDVLMDHTKAYREKSFVSHPGGDELMVIIELENDEEAIALAQRISQDERLWVYEQKPIEDKGRMIVPGAVRIGIADADYAVDTTQLKQRADAAVIIAKHIGKSLGPEMAHTLSIIVYPGEGKGSPETRVRNLTHWILSNIEEFGMSPADTPSARLQATYEVALANLAKEHSTDEKFLSRLNELTGVFNTFLEHSGHYSNEILEHYLEALLHYEQPIPAEIQAVYDLSQNKDHRGTPSPASDATDPIQPARAQDAILFTVVGALVAVVFHKADLWNDVLVLASVTASLLVAQFRSGNDKPVYFFNMTKGHLGFNPAYFDLTPKMQKLFRYLSGPVLFGLELPHAITFWAGDHHSLSKSDRFHYYLRETFAYGAFLFGVHLLCYWIPPIVLISIFAMPTLCAGLMLKAHPLHSSFPVNAGEKHSSLLATSKRKIVMALGLIVLYFTPHHGPMYQPDITPVRNPAIQQMINKQKMEIQTIQQTTDPDRAAFAVALGNLHPKEPITLEHWMQELERESTLGTTEALKEIEKNNAVRNSYTAEGIKIKDLQTQSIPLNQGVINQAIDKIISSPLMKPTKKKIQSPTRNELLTLLMALLCEENPSKSAIGMGTSDDFGAWQTKQRAALADAFARLDQMLKLRVPDFDTNTEHNALTAGVLITMNFQNIQLNYPWLSAPSQRDNLIKLTEWSYNVGETSLYKALNIYLAQPGCDTNHFNANSFIHFVEKELPYHSSYKTKFSRQQRINLQASLVYIKTVYAYYDFFVDIVNTGKIPRMIYEEEGKPPRPVRPFNSAA